MAETIIKALIFMFFCARRAWRLLGALPALAGGLIAYEIGTQDVGLASAGYTQSNQFDPGS